MQKGNDTIRTVHIGANSVGIGLFVGQVTSGVPILFKVLEFTHKVALDTVQNIS